jgi:hypothetical protein
MICSAHAVGSAALATERVERRRAALLAANVAGDSCLIGAGEAGTLQALQGRNAARPLPLSPEQALSPKTPARGVTLSVNQVGAGRRPRVRRGS